jgi:hypothetical protein
MYTTSGGKSNTAKTLCCSQGFGRVDPSYNYDNLNNFLVLLLVKNIPALYRTRKFITVFTRRGHLSLSQVTIVQSTSSSPISLTPILIFFV